MAGQLPRYRALILGIETGASIHVSRPFLFVRGREHWETGRRGGQGGPGPLTWSVRCLSSITLKQIPIAWILSGQIRDLI